MNDNFEKRKKIIGDFINDSAYTPMKFKEIAHLLQVSKPQRAELKSVLDELEAEGKVSQGKAGKYHKGREDFLRGIYRAHEQGFGFVLIEGQEDVFIPEVYAKGALTNDEVEVVLFSVSKGRNREGKIIRIVERGIRTLVGLFQKSKNYGFVVPDNPKFAKDVFIPIEKSRGAVSGHKVLVELTYYGDEKKKPEGVVLEILGHVTDPGTDILSIVKDADIPTEFSNRVLKQAEKISETISAADCEGRKDIRNWLTVTIDGEDAKDLDDAISLNKEGNLYTLGVHIADVTNYVQENSALDREALKRGTSVYLADRVIPMLPHKLSNGICSLNAGEDRLTLSCIMQINQAGEVVSHEIAETVIHVDERLSYTGVKKILEDQDVEEIEKYTHLLVLLREMKELSKILREKRYQRGGIDFDFPEAKIVLDEMGHPIEIRPYERNVATKIIEDFMLLANETVAENCFWQEIPFLYRIHETPENDKMKQLNLFLNNIGYAMHIGQNEIRPKEVQKLLAQIEGKPEEALVSRLALRAMKKARYAAENTGHFGLASSYYTHFTSPIRRYPDLQIHRIMKEMLRGRLDEGRQEHYKRMLPEVAKQVSMTERRAEEAERETIKLKKAEYMKEYLGEAFTGVISGITKWGLYVELPNTVEGLVHVVNMRDDHYDYCEETCEMVGEHTGKTYRLGETVEVIVLEVNLLRRTIDFALA